MHIQTPLNRTHDSDVYILRTKKETANRQRLLAAAGMTASLPSLAFCGLLTTPELYQICLVTDELLRSHACHKTNLIAPQHE